MVNIGHRMFLTVYESFTFASITRKQVANDPYAFVQKFPPMNKDYRDWQRFIEIDREPINERYARKILKNCNKKKTSKNFT